MRASLASWVSDADKLRYLNLFGVTDIPVTLAYQQWRKDDLYLALVGELFDRMRNDYSRPDNWAKLGNALALFVTDDEAQIKSIGVSKEDAAFFAATSFYLGGFPASANLIMRYCGSASENEVIQACYDFLTRPTSIKSKIITDLVNALKNGDLKAIVAFERNVSDEAQKTIQIGPDQWIPLRLLEKLMDHFCNTNIRSVLPEGHLDFWNPLVSSFLDRQPSTWDFFPSQIQAIQNGLLQRKDTFSLQMPTGAGKTALCETLLYWHLNCNPDDVAVMLVPYRSLASELRNTLIVRLNKMGISARCAYGGTVPSGDEVRAFDNTRALVATPETLSGILSANQSFFNRISLVICDEGHLLDAPSRGVGLELLLARMKVRETGAPRFVFVSAIVPNIEEINTWLGGSSDSVVRSDYRPALAEFSVLRPARNGSTSPVDLEIHPHEEQPIRFKIENFLRREDFIWRNPRTGKFNTYSFASVKTRAIAAARKTLPMGTAVVFAANKRGKQGAIGLAEEVLKQLDKSLRLPDPVEYADQNEIRDIAEYLEREYGREWIGTRALRSGVILHHGDIPQETREVLEDALRKRIARFGICTNTLAEGVNLPIQTLVLYSVQRLGASGARKDLLTRDIKNLVGRAGRAGITTKGLVICANEQQWSLIAAVARQARGERVVGALRLLLENVRKELALKNLTLTNELLERSPVVHSLIDGIDDVLVDLAAIEIGDDELFSIADKIADQTFAAQQSMDETKQVLKTVFNLRVQIVSKIRENGQLHWIRETGTHVRMLDLVKSRLLPLRTRWDDVIDPTDSDLVNIILQWSWEQREIQNAVRAAYRLEETEPINSIRDAFFNTIRLWLAGATFSDLAKNAELSIDDMLGLHAQVISFTLQTIVEQGIALLEKLLTSQEQMLAPAVINLPEHLRFGVPSAAGLILASGGVHHRHAYVTLGKVHELNQLANNRKKLFPVARLMLKQDLKSWRSILGNLVLERTLKDLS